MNDARNPGDAAATDRADDAGFVDLAGESLHAVRRYAGDVSDLAALEVRLASTTAIRMAVVGAAVTVVAIAAWLLIQIAAAFWLAEIGWPVAAVLAVLAVVNAIIGWVLVKYLTRLSSRLTFPATRRLLFENKDDADSDSKNRRPATDHRELARRNRAA